MGPADLLLGVKISQLEEGIGMDQQHFVESLLEVYGMQDCKPISTPLVPNKHLGPATEEERVAFDSLQINFRSAVESINYLSTATWPDLSFAVSSLSQYLEKTRYATLEGFPPCSQIPSWDTRNRILVLLGRRGRPHLL
ncbi:hypothetical protein O181_062801 [Austropuccinia psidii MF-1]|uniref:Uncharacterized protein n=1 Tax=Austropuccinia psidii MF-1 TaxID=1389203 RepID=A0A9Q3EQH1_9BASI|nr:hypothetical protein [Austropuccinia psidii MF-1]